MRLPSLLRASGRVLHSQRLPPWAHLLQGAISTAPSAIPDLTITHHHHPSPVLGYTRVHLNPQLAQATHHHHHHPSSSATPISLSSIPSTSLPSSIVPGVHRPYYSDTRARLSPSAVSHSSSSSSFSSSSAAMSTVAGGEEAEVFGRRRGNAAIAVLNRPKALNALNDNMVKLLKGLLEEWESDASVNLVIVKSEGRAFCAGGDVRTCYNLGKEGKWEEAAEFFKKEYELDYLVATYKKPYIALIDGVVMGGGNGISMLGPFRVVSEKVLFAMPETLIGLHPDVGASHFLPRLPGHLGEFLALTGFRLKAADMLACGLATHIVPSSRMPMLEERLCVLRVPNEEGIDLAIKEHADAAHPLEMVVMHRLDIINKCFKHPTLEEIIAALEEGAAASPDAAAEAAAAAEGGAAQGTGSSDAVEIARADAAADAEWCAQTLATLKKMSPTSLKVSLRSIREGRQQSLEECLVKETRLSYRCMEQTTSHDYYEGVRALLVDKDNNPKWLPPTAEEVTSEMVDAHFRPFSRKEMELQLPRRIKAPTHSRSLL